jgi:phthiocerol/phenolphthiocerol synthesis type-I polyketide synthase E
MKENYEFTGLEIAVIGMAGRFPGAKNTREFWENLKNGVESITVFTDEQLKEAGISAELVENPNYIKAKGVLTGIEYFDPAFFNFTPKEAEIMDPQLRIFFECAWHALEDAGYNPGTYNGDIGVYAGNGVNHYWVAKTIFARQFQAFGKFKADLLNTHFSTRLSYHLNLKGPSLTINTTCSTSLVTIHTACLALLANECDMALAGGVSLDLPQESGYLFMEGLILAPDGHCRAFDAEARGTVVGSGAGVVVLKRLEDAQADGDHIYALVKGSAINNDGWRKVGYTAPSVEGQAQTTRAAQINAAIDPATIGYLETHGTGTDLGDVVEIEALTRVFKRNEKKSIAIGSVKTNVGHLDTAAGVAGFIKTVLALNHRQIPPSLHFKKPNPKIDFENSPFYVITRLENWENREYPLRAGVSSFGLGGTNAHVILEEAPRPAGETATVSRDPSPALSPCRLLLLSAKNPALLDQMNRNLAGFLQENPGLDLVDIAYTLQVGRRALPCRQMALCSSREEAVDRLSQPGKSKKVKFSYLKKSDPPVIFLLPGQGSQYPGMGIELYRKVPEFRRHLGECFERLTPLLGFDIKEVLYPAARPDGSGQSDKSNTSDTSDRSGQIDRTEITQPLVFAFEYALARVLMGWGIKPWAMIGYSMGEYIAACLSGVFSLEDALKIVVLRGQLLRSTPPATMLSIPLPVEEIRELLADYKEISLAIINGPTSIVAGPVPAVAELEKRLKERRLICAAINLAHAVHSPLMEPIRREFEDRLGEISFHTPQIPYISNLSGDWITVEQATSPGYWAEHLCTTVRFADGVKKLLAEESAIFIEVGPGRLLSNIVRHHLDPAKKNGPRVVSLVKHQQEKVADDYLLLEKIGELWLHGVNVDWVGFNAREKPGRVSLPGYPFERKRYWIDEDPFAAASRLGSPQEQVPEKKPEPDGQTRQIREETEPAPGMVPEFYEVEAEEYVAPRDEVEQITAEVWQEFLGFDRISIDSNFFEINGDSLTATQLVTRLQHIYPVEISLEDFLLEPTIAQLAEMIRTSLIEKVKSLSDEELDQII